MDNPIVAVDYTESTVIAELDTLDGERLVVTDERHIDTDGVNHEISITYLADGVALEKTCLSPGDASRLSEALLLEVAR